jgi:hypothetical protein
MKRLHHFCCCNVGNRADGAPRSEHGLSLARSITFLFAGQPRKGRPLFEAGLQWIISARLISKRTREPTLTPG